MEAQQTLTPIPPQRVSLAVIDNTHPETNRQREYRCYLQSQRWRTLAYAVRMRAKGKCEICLRANGEECAHLTYERIFHELITDLLWVCKKCHRELDNR